MSDEARVSVMKTENGAVRMAMAMPNGETHWADLEPKDALRLAEWLEALAKDQMRAGRHLRLVGSK